MKRKSRISLGPGAASLILIFLVLSMSMLGMLSLLNGRNDAALSERSVRVTEEIYRLNVEAERSRGELDSILADAASRASSDEEYLLLIRERLPERMELEDRIIAWTEEGGSHNLHCAVQVFPLPQNESDKNPEERDMPESNPNADQAPGGNISEPGIRETWISHRLSSIIINESEGAGLVEFED